MGTSRKQNEDRYDYKMDPSGEKTGKPYAYIGVYDGHGGFATADWCKERLFDYVVENWSQESPDRSTRLGFINADRELLDKRGFLGLGERGVGGSKCGSTAAVALVYKAKGVATLLAAGAGDARVLVCEDGKEPVQLTIDHVPDTESERQRIEAANPNLNMPIVQYVGGTWRVGGLLALSRSLGDAYMKESLVYEGISDKGNNYGSGFGVIADPDVEIVDINGKKGWLIVSSDGLNTNEERGGGGGLDNNEVSKRCADAKDPDALAKLLIKDAVAAGSTDDVSVVCVRLEDLQ